MRFIPKSHYMSDAPSQIGESITINHTDCPAGRDERKRLWVKRVENGVIASCRNCGLQGFNKNQRFLNSVVAKNATVALKSTDKLQLINELPIEAYKWLLPYELTLDEIENNWKWCEEYQRLICTFGDSWVGRGIYPDQHPKYLSNIQNTKIYAILKEDTQTLVFVEDIISAIKVGREHSVVALLGTSLNLEYVHKIIEPYKQILVWLDGDKAGMNAADKMVKTFNLFKPTKKVETRSDPKNYTLTEIREYISSAS